LESYTIFGFKYVSFRSFVCVPLFFCVFYWSLLSLLFFVGFIAGDRPSTDLIWLSTVPALQQSFNGGYCLYHNGLFTEFFCTCHRLMRPWNRLSLYVIACYLVLLDQIQNLFLNLYCIYLLGFVVGVSSPFMAN
jgi:hypothetical protein